MPKVKRAPYIAALWLANFRSFKSMKEAIPFRRLTFIVGPNSSGKSSLMHAMLFLSQSGLVSFGDSVPVWRGSLTDLGSYQDSVFGHDSKRQIEIELIISDATDEPLVFAVTLSSASDPIGIVSKIVVGDTDTGFQLSVNRKRGRGRIYSIRGSHSSRPIMDWRPGSASYAHDLMDYIMTALAKVIADSPRRSPEHASARRLRRALGSYIIARFMYGTQRVASGRLPPERWYSRGGEEHRERRSNLDRVDPQLISNTNSSRRQKHTIQDLLNELEMVSSLKAFNLSAYHTSISTKDYITGIDANLTDVGYGVSQSIPILKALTEERISPLFVEQPEIHLHPQAQGALAEKLCLESLDRQVVIETHSERIINRARILVAEGKLSWRDVQILYVDKVKNGSRVTPIGIDKQANFTSPWPKGFFDERYEDAMVLLRLQASKK